MPVRRIPFTHPSPLYILHACPSSLLLFLIPSRQQPLAHTMALQRQFNFFDKVELKDPEDPSKSPEIFKVRPMAPTLAPCKSFWQNGNKKKQTDQPNSNLQIVLTNTCSLSSQMWRQAVVAIWSWQTGQVSFISLTRLSRSSPSSRTTVGASHI